MSTGQYYDSTPEPLTVELTGPELRALISMDEVVRLLSVLFRPRGRPRAVLDGDDHDGQHMELAGHLQAIEELGGRLARLQADRISSTSP